MFQNDCDIQFANIHVSIIIHIWTNIFNGTELSKHSAAPYRSSSAHIYLMDPILIHTVIELLFL